MIIWTETVIIIMLWCVLGKMCQKAAAFDAHLQFGIGSNYNAVRRQNGDRKHMWNLLAFAEEGAAQTADAAAQAGGPMAMVVSLAPMILLVVVFYFILIRPQRKKDKENKAMLEALKVGDKITTIGGIVGAITKIKDDKIVIETGFGTEKQSMMMERWAVRDVEKKISD